MPIADDQREALKNRLLSAVVDGERRHLDDLDAVAKAAVPDLESDDYIQLVQELVDDRLLRAEPTTVEERRMPLAWSIERATGQGRTRAAEFDRSILPLEGELARRSDAIVQPMPAFAWASASAGAPTTTAPTGPAVALTIVEVVRIVEPMLAGVSMLRETYPLTPEEGAELDDAMNEAAKELRQAEPSPERLRERLRRVMKSPMFNTMLGAALSQGLSLVVAHL